MLIFNLKLNVKIKQLFLHKCVKIEIFSDKTGMCFVKRLNVRKLRLKNFPNPLANGLGKLRKA